MPSRPFSWEREELLVEAKLTPVSYTWKDLGLRTREDEVPISALSLMRANGHCAVPGLSSARGESRAPFQNWLLAVTPFPS